MENGRNTGGEIILREQASGGGLAFLCRVHHRHLAEGTFSSPVVGLDLHLEGAVRRQALVGVDVARRLHVGDRHHRPRLRVVPPERQDVAEAVAVLVLSGHRLQRAGQTSRNNIILILQFIKIIQKIPPHFVVT